jgi:hypothetical protein
MVWQTRQLSSLVPTTHGYSSRKAAKNSGFASADDGEIMITANASVTHRRSLLEFRIYRSPSAGSANRAIGKYRGKLP